MPDFNEFLTVLAANIKQFALENWKEQAEAVMADGTSFVNKLKADLARWTEELASGKLTKDDFEWLIKSKKDVAEMEALKQAGLAQARLARCRKGLVDIVVKTAFKMLI